MSSSALKLLAASGAKGDPVYVDDVFSTFLYDGTGAAQTITNNIDFSGEGGLTWIKSRTHGGNHNLIDTVRGSSYVLESDGTGAQGTNTGQFTFNNNGFTINNVAAWDINQNNQNYASWSFRKQPGFFDVVTWSGDGTTNRQISHSLGSTPGMIIVKSRTGSDNWYTYHRSLGSGKFVKLNATDGAFTDTPGDMWGNTDPTDSVFTVGNPGYLNYSGWDYVAYLFAHDAQDFGTDSDESIVKCGSFSYTAGTPLAVDLGFEAQWVITKRTNATEHWYMADIMRGMYDGDGPYLAANLSNAEGAVGVAAATATGFIFDPGTNNMPTGDYIYMAIRRPNKPASEFAATDLFNPTAVTQDGKPSAVTNFPVDLGIMRNYGGAEVSYVNDRLRGRARLNTAATDAEVAGSAAFVLDYNNGYLETTWDTSSYSAWSWRRAPGYFDVVAYAGNGVTGRDIPHNLSVAPEMVWAKGRSLGTYWSVWHSAYGTSNNQLRLESDSALSSNTSYFAENASTPPVMSNTTFSVSANGYINGSGQTYIAYLFATVAGISKVGSYTGTGNDLNVACGFSAGARFVMIKRTDSTGDWYVWDTYRGIAAGNDPYLLMNDTAAQVTNTDYIDPLASGFTVTSSAPAALNNNGGTYIFYAIA
jgi:hypothetical protein